ncbi:glycosyltransferase [Xylocopilactobacillus apis]|uniref:Glycosyl transferase n=1 Tax=Xylocopilactobacillus apis TaxID=2932183 RepID=A0AAU9D6Y4_9LACO|nr:glycosyltransferase [Xylocopilactobacillus apis]BDR57175.1 glycosyl transferase [Xylocopilactobacillus apis]
MKVVNINAGQETGGALTHLIFMAQVLKEHNIDNVLLVFEEGTISKAARELGLAYKVINQKNTSEWINYLNENNFDLVQTHGPRANFLVTLHRKNIHVPHIVTVHSDPRYDFLGGGIKGNIQSKLNVWSLKHSDGLFVVSSELKDELTKLGINSNRIVQINNAMTFSNDVRPKENHQFMQMIIVARLHPVKEHARLIKALSEVKNDHIFLNIVGDGELRESLEQLVDQYELNHQVEFYGALKSSEINELYRKMDLALIVSKSEGFPLVFLEAANNAVPVLMTELSATHLVIPDEEHGIAVDNSLEGIKSGIEKAYSFGIEQLSEMGLKNRKYAIDHFGPESFYKQMKNGYDLFSKKENL